MKVRITAVLAAVMVMLLSCFPVYAVEENDSIELVHPNSYRQMSVKTAVETEPKYKSDHAYFRDEAEILTDASMRRRIFDSIKNTAEDTGVNIAVYIGGYVRHDYALEEFSRQACEELFPSDTSRDTVFYYIDFDGNDALNDMIYTLNNQYVFAPDDSLKSKIISNVREVITYNPEGFSQSLLETGIKRYLDKLKEYIDNTVQDREIAHLIHSGKSGEMPVQQALESDKYYRSDHAYFKDEAGIFNESLQNEMFEKTKKTAAAIDMNVAVFIGGYKRNDDFTVDFAGEASEYLFGTDDSVDAVFLYLDFEGNLPGQGYDLINAYHNAYFYYPDLGEDDNSRKNRVQRMLDDMYNYLPKSGQEIRLSKVKSAIDVFLEDLVKYKEAGVVNGLHYRSAESGLYYFTEFGKISSAPIYYNHFFIFLLISLVAGAAAFYFYGNHIKNKYKFRESYSASGYTSQNNMRINTSSDVFIREYTTKIKIESSSGGHHGGGHHSGHSSSHHSGGRHR